MNLKVVGISARALQRRGREEDGGEDRRRGPNTVPGNKLGEHEEHRLLRLLTSPGRGSARRDNRAGWAASADGRSTSQGKTTLPFSPSPWYGAIDAESPEEP